MVPSGCRGCFEGSGTCYSGLGGDAAIHYGGAGCVVEAHHIASADKVF